MKFTDSLPLSDCPHCGRAHPTFTRPSYGGAGGMGNWTTRSGVDHSVQVWGVFVCGSCGGCVLVASRKSQGSEFTIATAARNGEIGIDFFYPEKRKIDPALPDQARRFLMQAQDTIHAPDGAVMLAAASIDAMLKHTGYTDGTLFKRIEKAVSDGKITPEMARWAHQVRLDSNDPRHADLDSAPHTQNSARRALDFALALAEILFVLPQRVTRGINEVDVDRAIRNAKVQDNPET